MFVFRKRIALIKKQQFKAMLAIKLLNLQA